MLREKKKQEKHIKLSIFETYYAKQDDIKLVETINQHGVVIRSTKLSQQLGHSFPFLIDWRD